MRIITLRTARLLASAAGLSLLALGLGGCKTMRTADTTGSIGATAPMSEQAWRADADNWGARYRANPGDPRAAIEYAQALRAIGQRAQAAAVLEQATIRHPHDRALLGAYGRALADTGRFQQALDVLSRAHTPDQPDWRILSVQGAVLDQMGRHEDARRYYAAALRLHPNEPSVLSNLGLSYALSKDLARAEQTLRQAAAQRPIDPRVRQNLALVVGLQGRFGEAEAIAGADLPAAQAAANIATLRQMVAQHQEHEAKTPAPPPRSVSGTSRRGRPLRISRH
jgi:Flp pilus assembly protein TadD